MLYIWLGLATLFSGLATLFSGLTTLFSGLTTLFSGLTTFGTRIPHGVHASGRQTVRFVVH